MLFKFCWFLIKAFRVLLMRSSIISVRKGRHYFASTKVRNRKGSLDVQYEYTDPFPTTKAISQCVFISIIVSFLSIWYFSGWLWSLQAFIYINGERIEASQYWASYFESSGRISSLGSRTLHLGLEAGDRLSLATGDEGHYGEFSGLWYITLCLSSDSDMATARRTGAWVHNMDRSEQLIKYPSQNWACQCQNIFYTWYLDTIYLNFLHLSDVF